MKLPLQLLLHLLGVSILRTHESYQPLLHLGCSTETETECEFDSVTGVCKAYSSVSLPLVCA